MNKRLKNLSNEIISFYKRSKYKKQKHLHEPFFNYEDIKSVNNAIKKKEVSTYGNFVLEFEKKIARFIKSKFCTATINGTSALHLALLSLDVGKRDEVLIPSVSFIAAANSISYCGATPYFIDSELETFGVDIKKLEEFLKKNTKLVNGKCFNKKTGKQIKAIIAVHVFGLSMKIRELIKLAKKYRIFVVEDAAEALGSYNSKKHLGTFGDIGVLSFNGNKIITTGGGGAIVTKKRKLADRIKRLSTVNKKDNTWNYDYHNVGFNYRMPSLNAALGLAQLKKLKKFLRKKRNIHKKLQNSLKKIKYVKVIKEMKNTKSNYWLLSLQISQMKDKDKKKLIDELRENNILCRPIWLNIDKLPFYKNCPKTNLFNARKIEKEVITLPSSFFLF